MSTKSIDKFLPTSAEMFEAAELFGVYDRIVVCDFETYYDRDYTLKELTTYEYVADPRFELLFGVAFEYVRGTSAPKLHVLRSDTVAGAFQRFGAGRALFVAHNAVFDAAVVRRFYPCPLSWVCTMQMAHQQGLLMAGSVSLAALSAHYGIPVEKETIIRMQGKRVVDLTREEFGRFFAYARADAIACAALFVRQDILGADEPKLLEWTIRRAVYPSLRVDLPLLEETVVTEEARMAEAMDRMGLTSTMLRSARRFAELLEARGIEVPRKPGAAGAVPAVAKTDPFMEELLGHDDPEIAQLAELRLRAMSSLTRTRAARMLAVGRALRGELAVPLNWHKARTGRWTGAERLNLQNLSRGHGPLRRAIMAPEDRVLVVVDAAQIEARIVAAIAGADSLSRAFAEGRDVYSEFASTLYGHPVTKTSHPQKRQVGKLAILSLGYGCGAAKFRQIARVSGGVHLDEDEAERIVSTYRQTWPEIPALWRYLDAMLKLMLDHDELPVNLPNPTAAPLYWSAPALYLPSGRPILFNGLAYDPEMRRFTVLHYQHGRVLPRPIWGGHLTENIVQAMARDVLCRAHLKYIDKVVLQVHDELVLVATREEANELLQACIRDLSSTVEWLPSCGLAAEGAVSFRYGDAK
jgi:DNA polymerase